MIIELGVQGQTREVMKGYEGRYDSKHETQEEGADKYSEKITTGLEKGGGVEGVSRTRLVVGGDRTGSKNHKRFCYRTKRSQQHD